MRTNLVTLVLAIAMVVVAAAGVVATAVTSDRDLLVCFGLLLVLALVQLARLRGSRPAVAVRADLVRWLAARAQLSGEPIGQVADRAISTYRASLGEGGGADDSGSP